MTNKSNLSNQFSDLLFRRVRTDVTLFSFGMKTYPWACIILWVLKSYSRTIRTMAATGNDILPSQP